jgi:hypothetical protein
MKLDGSLYGHGFGCFELNGTVWVSIYPTSTFS